LAEQENVYEKGGDEQGDIVVFTTITSIERGNYTMITKPQGHHTQPVLASAVQHDLELLPIQHQLITSSNPAWITFPVFGGTGIGFTVNIFLK
jgi:hypothetical protein